MHELNFRFLYYYFEAHLGVDSLIFNGWYWIFFFLSLQNRGCFITLIRIVGTFFRRNRRFFLRNRLFLFIKNFFFRKCSFRSKMYFFLQKRLFSFKNFFFPSKASLFLGKCFTFPHNRSLEEEIIFRSKTSVSIKNDVFCSNWFFRLKMTSHR